MNQDEQTPLRIFVADDVPDMRALVRFALEDAPDMVVVGEAGNGAEAVAGIGRTRPDVVLLDLSMPDLDGLEVIPVVIEQSPETGIVVFSGFEAARMRGPTTDLGAHRYVEKGRPLDELRAAIREVGEAKRAGTLPPLDGDGPNGGAATGGPSMSAMWRLLLGLRPWPRPGPATD
ncbi:MAG TPA: response regulator transcription factor [Solirubrobacteraceae bacterium]|jgi:DNA-binding NarL/FixJ family response regulator|nr:response regulator transcription factor [Solirubrobacteraceae bacterium]